MPASRRFGALAFGKQSGIVAVGGTAAAAPLFQVPILSGGLTPQKDSGDLPRIGSTLARLGRYTQRARVGGSVQMLAHPEALGLLLYEAFGTQAVSGAGPYAHRFTLSDTYPADPLTVWSNVGTTGTTGSVWRMTDVFVNSLSIEGTSGENLVVNVDFTGFGYTPTSTIPAVTGTGSSVEDADPRFKFIGSSVKLDADSTAAVNVTNIESVTFEVDRAPEIRYGPSLTPSIISPDRMVNFSVGMTYDSAQQGWDFVLTNFTGSPSGTGPDQSTAAGSFDVIFGRHPHSPSPWTAGVSATAAQAGAVATYTVASHSILAGQAFTVTGMTPAGYNGTFIAESITATTVVTTLNVSALGAGTGGTLYENNDEYLRITSGGSTVTNPLPQANWHYDLSMPEAAADPGILEFDVAGIVTNPTTGTSEVQVILVNDFVNTY